MASFSEEQFRQLLLAIAPKGPTEIPLQHPKNDPAALGPMRPCILGTNKMMKLTKFTEWLEEAENRMTYIGTTDDTAKVILLKTWGGQELTEFIKTSKIDVQETNAELTENVEDEDSYTKLVAAIHEQLRKLVNRTMAMHDLLTTKQGSRKWMDYIHELEQKAKILNCNQKPYTSHDAVKDAAIFGMSDTRLREKSSGRRS